MRLNKSIKGKVIHRIEAKLEKVTSLSTVEMFISQVKEREMC
jgi:ribosomal protein S3